MKTTDFAHIETGDFIHVAFSNASEVSGLAAWDDDGDLVIDIDPDTCQSIWLTVAGRARPDRIVRHTRASEVAQ